MTLTCPFCGSEDVEPIGAWGGQIITSQLRCRACHTYFEAIRGEFDAVEDAGGFEPDAGRFDADSESDAESSITGRDRRG